MDQSNRPRPDADNTEVRKPYAKPTLRVFQPGTAEHERAQRALADAASRHGKAG